MGDVNLWLSLLLAIPLSILANIVTPFVQRWLDKFNEKRVLERTKGLQKEYEQVKHFAEDRSEFKEYLLWVVIRTTLVGSLVGIFSQALNAVGNILYVGGILYAISQVIGIIGSIMVINLCSDALKIYSKVQRFDEYQKFVVKEFPEGSIS
jgi:hypothetical protein